jgi:hypothetical protein
MECGYAANVEIAEGEALPKTPAFNPPDLMPTSVAELYK